MSLDASLGISQPNAVGIPGKASNLDPPNAFLVCTMNIFFQVLEARATIALSSFALSTLSTCWKAECVAHVLHETEFEPRDGSDDGRHLKAFVHRPLLFFVGSAWPWPKTC